MTLSEKWTLFTKKLPAEAGQQQILFAQACYLAGAQASFQILGAASDKTPEEAIIIWGELQREIMTAVRTPSQPLSPLEKPIIV